MLLEGKWEDENGVRYTIPCLKTDRNGEKDLVARARANAHEKGVRVCRVWGVWIEERQIRLS